MSISAGELDQRIEVRTLSVVKNDFNEDVRSWPASDPPAKRWAAVKEGQGRDFVKGAAQVNQRLVAFKLRWSTSPRPGDRVLWGGATFSVEEFTGTRQSGELWLHCKSVEV